ncbi:hypothetical protein [Nannocystis sp. SCPEA4]|uniref:hypothetical protein n=1 Tax=Nannocystis sp. SCPEA4 TaxID=2996787 RepID=UPI00226F22EC|nr:hypothetical protein [Nannocystis sp. SCPEA4]MCY1059089.1 hypothetical protein [Nannocystis sp. SCPEA4]
MPTRHLQHAALLALLASLPGCSNDSPGTTVCGTASCSATDTTTTDASTSTPTTGPALCGNAVVDPGELCDDGDDCDDGVCNLDAYTGKEHCAATCGGLYPNWCGDKAMQAQETCDEGGNTPTCDADCTPVECGDGLLNAPAGEACDDGPANSDAYDDTPDQLACNTTCTGTAPHCGDGICQDTHEDATCVDCTCGDGITSAPETCDDGMTGEPTDTPTCDADCTAVECGDGHHNPTTGEWCDDGNLVDTDECRNNCTTCGDGDLHPGEECDDGNDVDDDACSNACIKPRLVFVTSTLHNGALGGLAGADMQCAAAGMAANPNLPATAWRAWLSDDTGSPSTRFDTTFTGWYQLVDGTPIAKGWSDLTDGNLAAPINLTESAAAPVNPLNAWSNTSPAGTTIGTEHCSKWTNSNLDPDGRLGQVTTTDSAWTDANGMVLNPTVCSAGLHLYCFQNTP